jgi:multisite-specific tRNA:(cytosine-C5)-methyltransferase
LAVQQRLVDHYIPQIIGVKHEGKIVDPPRPIEWYPEKLAWAMTTPKNVIRKFPPFASFQKFLVSETSVGNISRQEVVSMIPPLLLDIRPGMTVLDMCAAPGSKSAQLIELLHGGEEARIRKIVQEVAKEQGREASPGGIEVKAEESEPAAENDWSDDGRATGLLVANDREYKRAQMLVHQVKRLNSPNIIVTNHDATQFPSIRIPSNGAPKYMKFDRILADVPCSGDGTVRKSPNIWKDWLPGSSLGLHVTQVRILVRALQMLKVGGRVVYSTCSLNPVENEAVISAAIDRCGGNSKVRIVDCKDQLPGLKRTPGLRSWNIIDKKGRIWRSWEEYSEATKGEEVDEKMKLVQGMFPLTTESDEDPVPIERCVRVYPHFQDTGGFFITALEKLSEIRARPENVPKTKPASTIKKIIDEQEQAAEAATGQTANGSSSPAKRAREDDEGTSSSPKKQKLDSDATMDTDITIPEISANGTSTPAPRIDDYAAPKDLGYPGGKKKGDQPFEEPYKYLAPDHPELLKIYDFYEISPRFPKDRYMVRNATGQPVKAIYYTSERVRDILVCNEGQGIKFVQAGVKMFMKQDAQGQDICRWRIQSEGIPILEPWVGEGRVVRLYKRETLRKLLIEMFPKIGNGEWKKFGEIGERAVEIGMGCCVLRIETGDAEDGFKYVSGLRTVSRLTNNSLQRTNHHSVMAKHQLYQPDVAQRRTKSHAASSLQRRVGACRQFEGLQACEDRTGHI